jgi:hypothetical protein
MFFHAALVDLFRLQRFDPEYGERSRSEQVSAIHEGRDRFLESQRWTFPFLRQYSLHIRSQLSPRKLPMFLP